MKQPPKKSLGQNFLHDKNIIEKIIKCINPKNTEHFIEIGPGYGALTCELLQHTKKIDAIELDQDLIPELEKNALNLGDLTIHHLDALKLDIKSISSSPVRVAGNLPYQISTPLIFHLIDQIEYIVDMHFMLQKEVVDRMCAKPGSKTYGRLSVMVQYYCEAISLFDVPPTAFNPQPQVFSSIVRLVPHKTLPYPSNNVERLENIVRECFNHRRKTIRKSLKSFISSEDLESLNIDPQLRPEQLSIRNFVDISNK